MSVANERSPEWAEGRISGYETVLSFLDHVAKGREGWDQETVQLIRDVVQGMAEGCSHYASALTNPEAIEGA
jgi:hypothetical protein